MQTLTREHTAGPISAANSASRIVITVAIILFAFAGLISGFSVGAFIHPSKPTTANTNNTGNTHPIVGQTPVVTKTPLTQHPFLLGEPKITQTTYTEVADGTTTYTFAGEAVNKANTPVFNNSITCKIWLTKKGNTADIINADDFARLKSISTIQQPFPKETVGGLGFTSATPQTQPCSATGPTTWNYTVSTSVDPGIYFIVLLTDWDGVHYNWYSAGINITR